MDGAALAAKRKYESEVAVAWHTANFTAAASVGKLQKLDHYLAKPKKAQTTEEMLAVFRAFKEMGAPLSIRQVN